jgi:hypothetical protein
VTPPKLSVDLVEVSSTLDALALRAALEWWGARVTLHLVGMAQDVVCILGGGEPLAEYIVLACHGDGRGLVLPELGLEIEQEQPYHGAITAADFHGFLKLPDKVVLNNGCALGRPEIAEAFLRAGARSYIGATDYPDGDSSLFYALHFFYDLIYNKMAIEEAHARASAHDKGTQMFRLYQKSE